MSNNGMFVHRDDARNHDARNHDARNHDARNHDIGCSGTYTFNKCAFDTW